MLIKTLVLNSNKCMSQVDRYLIIVFVNPVRTFLYKGVQKLSVLCISKGCFIGRLDICRSNLRGVVDNLLNKQANPAGPDNCNK